MKKGTFKKTRKMNKIVEFSRDNELTMHKVRTDDVVMIEAETGTGKTSYAVHLANDLLLSEKYSVQYFNISDAEDTVYKKIQSDYDGVKMDNLYKLDLLDEKGKSDDYDRINAYLPIRDGLDKYEAQIKDDLTIISYIYHINDILEVASENLSDSKRNAIIIDELQDIEKNRKYAADYETAHEVMADIALFAKKYNCLVIVTSGVTRYRLKKGPAICTIAESMAPVVIYLQQVDIEQYALPGNGKDSVIIKANMLKNRNGNTSPVYYLYTKSRNYWRELPEDSKAESEDK